MFAKPKPNGMEWEMEVNLQKRFCEELIENSKSAQKSHISNSDTMGWEVGLNTKNFLLGMHKMCRSTKKGHLWKPSIP